MIEIRDEKLYVSPHIYLWNPKTNKPMTLSEFPSGYAYSIKKLEVKK